MAEPSKRLFSTTYIGNGAATSLPLHVVKLGAIAGKTTQLPTKRGAPVAFLSRVQAAIRTGLASTVYSAIPEGITVPVTNCSKQFPLSRLSALARLMAGFCPIILAWGCGKAGLPEPVNPVETERTPTDFSLSKDSGSAQAEPETAPAQWALPTVPLHLEQRKTAAAWLDSRAVARAVRPHHGAFNTCHRLAATQVSDREGEVTVGWLVHPSGSIEEARVNRSTFSTSDVSDCVLTVAMRVKFPASRAPAEVSWTVKFRGERDSRLASAE